MVSRASLPAIGLVIMLMFRWSSLVRAYSSATSSASRLPANMSSRPDCQTVRDAAAIVDGIHCSCP
jgi:hypothetical protein